MKLEHLIQAYNFNNIQANIKEEYKEAEERAGVIEFDKNINASYLLDDEDIIVDMIIFCNCIELPARSSNKDLTIINQIDYTIRIINVLQKTIELISDVPKKEANMILEKLGMFDSTFKEGKQIKHLEHSFSINIYEGLLKFEIKELVSK